jgi:MYXO-CTERM domain-containing protein
MPRPLRSRPSATLTTLAWSVVASLAVTGIAPAANLELVFDQSSFGANTTGTFRLTGEIPALGFGSAGYYIGEEYFNEYHSFSSDYTLAFDTPPPVAIDYLYLYATAASGTAVRDAVSYTIRSSPGVNLSFYGGGSAQLQVYLENLPDPNFNSEAYLSDSTLGTFLVDISGSFGLSATADGSSPASRGVSLANLAGTNTSVYPWTGDTLGVTVSAPVPEPTTGAMAALAVAALLAHHRRRATTVGRSRPGGVSRGRISKAVRPG